MKRVLVVIGLLLAAACTPAADAPAPAVEAAPAQDAAIADAPAPPPPAPPVADPGTEWERRLGNLPPDAADVIGRVEACNHFAGEFNGDRSERDREVAARMEELRCARVEADATAVRAMYGDRPDVMEALDMANRGLR